MNADPVNPDPEGTKPVGSNLERRYRSLLRVLPAWYRAEREEEMVAIFLEDRTDDLDLEHGWPGWGEAGATAALAVRVRFAARRRAGEVARVVGLAGLVGQLVLAAQGAVAAVAFGGTWAPWFDVAAVTAFAGLLAGRRGVARTAVGVLALWALVWVAVAQPLGWMTLWPLPMWVTAAAVLLGFHREAPPVPRARWSAAAVTAVLLGAAWAVVEPLSVVGVAVAWLVTTAVVVGFRPWTTTAAA